MCHWLKKGLQELKRTEKNTSTLIVKCAATIKTFFIFVINKKCLQTIIAKFLFWTITRLTMKTADAELGL